MAESPRPKSVSGHAGSSPFLMTMMMNGSGGGLEEEFPNLALYQRERRPSANAILQSTTNNNSNTNNAFIIGTNKVLGVGGGGYGNVYGEEVTTIHVAGLPEDVTEREFVNMFMFAPGFETAVIRYNHNPAITGSLNTNTTSTTNNAVTNNAPTNNATNTTEEEEEHQELGSPFTIGLPPLIKSQQQSVQQSVAETVVVGFARFQTRQDAMDARDHLNGKVMDNGKSVLRVELARKNLLMPLLSQGSYTIPISKSELLQQQQQIPRRQSFAGSIPNLGNDFIFSPYPPQSEMSCYSPSSICSSSMDIIGNSTISSMLNSPIGFVPRPQLPPQVSANGGRHSISAKLVATTAAYPGVPPALIVGENPPCNTLYVGNLPVTATEEELWVLFSPCRGFKRLSFRLKPNGPMCFVEFEDIACATEAMETLYGTMLSCSVKGGIRLSYSKNPLGVRASVPQTPIYQNNMGISGDDENGNGLLILDTPIPQPNTNS